MSSTETSITGTSSMGTSITPAVVIGAGPYGLSVAAHLRARGINARVFGKVMSSWRTNMPAGMCLKSTPDASSLGAPAPGYSLTDYCLSEGIRPLQGDQVVPIQLFTRYGEWFQQRLVPDVEDETIRELRRTGHGFHLVLGSGEELMTPRVVVATGITGLAYVPRELAAIAPGGPSAGGLVSHSSQHDNLAGFRGARVAVIGAGQSALESAALLHEAGAATTVLARGTARFGNPPATPTNPYLEKLPQPHSPLGPTWRIYPFSHAAGLFPYLPAQTRLRLVKRVLGPLGAWWLADRRKIRPVSYAHTVGEILDAASKRGFEVAMDSRERTVSPYDVSQLGSRSAKWVGTKVWFEGILRLRWTRGCSCLLAYLFLDEDGMEGLSEFHVLKG